MKLQISFSECTPTLSGAHLTFRFAHIWPYINAKNLDLSCHENKLMYTTLTLHIIYKTNPYIQM